MKKLTILLFLFAINSCAIVNAPSGHGLLYTEVTEVIYYDPYVRPTQKARLCAKNYLGIVSKGDDSLDALHIHSSIRKISSIEKTYSSRLSLFSESCTIITGE